jgi:hypothetical protein
MVICPDKVLSHESKDMPALDNGDDTKYDADENAAANLVGGATRSALRSMASLARMMKLQNPLLGVMPRHPANTKAKVASASESLRYKVYSLFLKKTAFCLSILSSTTWLKNILNSEIILHQRFSFGF